MSAGMTPGLGLCRGVRVGVGAGGSKGCVSGGAETDWGPPCY